MLKIKNGRQRSNTIPEVFHLLLKRMPQLKMHRDSDDLTELASIGASTENAIRRTMIARTRMMRLIDSVLQLATVAKAKARATKAVAKVRARNRGRNPSRVPRHRRRRKDYPRKQLRS